MTITAQQLLDDIAKIIANTEDPEDALSIVSGYIIGARYAAEESDPKPDPAAALSKTVAKTAAKTAAAKKAAE